MNPQALPLWVNGLIVLGTIGLVGLGAHWLVDSASSVAKRLGISELVIGLTIVAAGTSAPEFAVAIIAAVRGQGDLSVGNVVGSSVFNLGFILGGSALVRAIPVGRTMLRRDGAVLAATMILLGAFIGWDLRLDRHDGVVLFVLLGVYLGYLYKHRRLGAGDRETGGVVEQAASLPRCSALLLVGLLCIIGGSHLLVESASVLARDFGVSEWVIGVTIVAAGTSAPEFATSLVGVLRGRYAMSAGNVIGSNIFNQLGVLGLAGIIHPVAIDASARVSLWTLSGMVLLAILFMRTGWRLSRLEGLALVASAASLWVLDLSG